MRDYCIAVFDVGKTNKKLAVFDSRLRLMDSAYRSFPEIESGGLKCEDVGAMEEWFLDELARASGRHPIRAISVTTHGATHAAVDASAELAYPVLSYTNEVDEAFNREFYDTFGDRIELQKSTATPHFDALLNVGKGIFFARKRFPEEFERAAAFLNYPQYFGARLTGKFGAESTYVGCHSFLWDFRESDWSSVARGLGIMDRLPGSVGRPWDVLGTLSPEAAERTGLPQSTLVTMGIHDSNASLLPYLIRTRGDFVLNSTGTWCVLMRPVHEASLNPEDLGKVVFFNLDAFARPVKTAIFGGGMEYDHYGELLRKTTGGELSNKYRQTLYKRIVRERELFILPEVFRGSGQFPDSAPRLVEAGVEIPLKDVEAGDRVPGFFRDPETASAALILSLALQTGVALKRVGFEPAGRLFVEGGFRQNEAYVSLLKALHPQASISLTSMKEATAYGAAVCAKLAVEDIEPSALEDMMDIEFMPVDGVDLPGLEAYRKAYLDRVG